MPRASVLITDESHGRPPHGRDRRRGPLRGHEPAARHVPGRDRHHELQEVRADGRRAAGRPASPAWTRSSSSAALTESVTVVGRGQERHRRSRARPSSAGLDEQQLRDLPAQQPRHAVVPAPQPERPRRHATTCSSSAAAPTASPTSRTARPRRTRSSARSATPRPASTRSPRSRCSRTPTAPSTAASPASWSRPSAAATPTAARPSTTSTRTSLNALTYNQKLGLSRTTDAAATPTPTPTSTAGARRFGGPIKSEQDVLLRELRGLERQGHLRRRPRHRPHRGHAGGRLLGRDLHDQGPADRACPSPGNVIPAEPPRPLGPEDHELLLPAAERGHRSPPATGVYQQFVPETRNRQRADLRIDHELELEGLALPPRELPAPRPAVNHVRGRQRAHQPADPRRRSSTPRAVDRRLDARSSRPPS